MGNIRSRYICRECGYVFEEPSRVQEIHHEVDGRQVEIFCVCPNCGDTFFEDAITCGYCEEEYAEDDMVAKLFCKKCIDEMIRCRQDIVKAYIGEDLESFAEFADEYMRKERQK